MSSRINSTITNLDQTLQSFALDAWRQFFKTKGLKSQCGWKGVSKAFSKFLSQHENPALRIMARLMDADQRRDDTIRRWIDQSLSESEMLALREKCIYTSKTRRDSTPEKVEAAQSMPQRVTEKLAEMVAVRNKLPQTPKSEPRMEEWNYLLGELQSTLDSVIDLMKDPN